MKKTRETKFELSTSDLYKELWSVLSSTESIVWEGVFTEVPKSFLRMTQNST